MYNDQVFCFTPKGNIINLPVHATAIDFAYAVHSELGNSAVGANINNKVWPFSFVRNETANRTGKDHYPTSRANNTRSGYRAMT